MHTRGAPEWIVATAAGMLLIGAVIGGLREWDAGSSDETASVTGTTVDIRAFRFGPDVLNVAVGETVSWTNLDSFTHTVAGTDGMPARSDDLGEGSSYEFTFTESGTFEYVCTIHVTMRGTVVVSEADA